MNAVVRPPLEQQFSTQVYPSGPIDVDDRLTAENTPEIYVVFKTRVHRESGGFSSTRILGAYWDLGTAQSVAASFNAQFELIEIGMLPTFSPEDLH